MKGKVSEETLYFISSLSANNPEKLGYAICAHGAIQNNLHWVLDLAFDEENNRTRKSYSTANLAGIMIFTQDYWHNLNPIVLVT